MSYIIFSCDTDRAITPDKDVKQSFLLLKKETSYYAVNNREEIISFYYNDSGLLTEEVRIDKSSNKLDSTVIALNYEYEEDTPVSCTYSKYNRVEIYDYKNDLLASRKTYLDNELNFTELMEYDNFGNLSKLVGLNALSENIVNVISSNKNVNFIQLISINGENTCSNPIV